jgi:hypothetical protein
MKKMAIPEMNRNLNETYRERLLLKVFGCSGFSNSPS